MLEEELNRARGEAAVGGEDDYERYSTLCERLGVRPGFFYWSCQLSGLIGESRTVDRGKSSTREGAVEGLKRAIGLDCVPSRYIHTKGIPDDAQIGYVDLVDVRGRAEAARWRGKFARRNGQRAVHETHPAAYGSRVILSRKEQKYAPAEGVWELGP